MTTKVCSKCKVEKDLGEFNNKKAAADGKAAYCTACNKAALVKWRSENPEKVRESSAKWRAENPEKARESSAKWRAKNPEKARESFAKWRAKNPEKAKERVEKWIVANPDKVKQRRAAESLRNREKNNEYARRKRLEALVDNPEKFKEKRKVAFLKWKANNPESFKRIRRNQANKQVARCSNSYVKAALKLPNPPQELIELKREHLQMHRVTQCLLKTLKDEDNE